MMSRTNIFSAVLLLCFYSVCSQSYRAAVVEYNTFADDSPTTTILRSTEHYLNFLSTAQLEHADIVIFPEYGLTGTDVANNIQYLDEYSTFLPDSNTGGYPCGSGANYSKALIDLSCAINERRLYVVVNLIEKAINETNGTVYYNTNVVFDRTGTVLTKYRKINLYQEAFLTPGNEAVTFTTDFGVTFGLLTSYDILFKTPINDILANNTITDIIYPSLWYSETPFGVGLSVQAGFARANRVNLLAAGYNDATLGVSGTGIYHYNGTSPETFIVAVRSSRVIVQYVPIVSTRDQFVCEDQIVPRGLSGIIGGVPDITALNVNRENLQNYTVASLDLINSRQISQSVCSGSNYCCTFNITLEENSVPSNGYFYKLVAFHGVRQLGNLTLGTRTCALVACASDDISTCGTLTQLLSPDTTFQSISVSGNFSNTTDTFDTPVTLLTNLQPLFYANYSYCALSSADQRTVTVSLVTKGPVSGVAAFGIFGRVFQIDRSEVGQTDAGVSVSASVLMVGLLAVVNYLIRD